MHLIVSNQIQRCQFKNLYILKKFNCALGFSDHTLDYIAV